MKIYVASSWRHSLQPQVVAELRETGAEVYDFRNPGPGKKGFAWSEIDPDWKKWNAETFRERLGSPIAQQGFANDMDALSACDVCVLVMPCGRSAHLELGWAAGAGKTSIVLLNEAEPELMYLMADYLCVNLGQVISVVSMLMKAERLARRRQ